MLTVTDWVSLGIWWFLFQQPRPGPKIPKGSNYFTIGWKQVFLAVHEIKHLPQTFLYLIAFFLLADGLNTTGTLVSVIQNNVVSFSFLEITYLGLSQAACSITSTWILVYPEVFRHQNEIHVHGYECLQRLYPILWHAGIMDRQNRLSPCARFLDLQHLIWTFSSSILRLRTNNDVGGDTPRL